MNDIEKLKKLGNQIPSIKGKGLIMCYKSAYQLLAQANNYRDSGDLEKAFIFYHRFIKFILQVINRPDSKEKLEELREEYKRKASNILNYLEELTPILKEKYNKKGLKKLPSYDTLTNLTLEKKSINIPKSLKDEFLDHCKENSSRNIETMGILSGVLFENIFLINYLIIPNQIGKSDTCESIDEEGILKVHMDNEIIMLGWIHTHPHPHSLFMSSIDVHTQFSYQMLLPEAIAIVISLKNNEINMGTFQLADDDAIKYLSKCDLSGFHSHEDCGVELYHDADHIKFVDDLELNFIDLRS